MLPGTNRTVIESSYLLQPLHQPIVQVEFLQFSPRTPGLLLEVLARGLGATNRHACQPVTEISSTEGIAEGNIREGCTLRWTVAHYGGNSSGMIYLGPRTRGRDRLMAELRLRKQGRKDEEKEPRFSPAPPVPRRSSMTNPPTYRFAGASVCLWLLANLVELEPRRSKTRTHHRAKLREGR